MQSEIQKLKTSFDSNNIPASLPWLEACYQWCKEEVLSANYNYNDLLSALHEQWTNLDLREIETQTLPPDLSEKKYMVLHGNFSLQVMQVVDISKPKYWQLQQIRKENVLTRPAKNEVNDAVGTGKRVLQLTLTDGVQYVEAMEYQPVSTLNINLKPGMKIRLIGPVTIRRGRVMLKEENVRVLGGEVEDLLVTNAAENILARALKLPENPNPDVVDANLLTVEQEPDIANRQEVGNSRIQQNNMIPTITNTRNALNNHNNESSRITKNISQNRNHYSSATGQADEYPTDEDFEMMMEVENQIENLDRNQNNSTRNQQNHNTNIEVNSNANPSTKFEDPYEEEIEMLMDAERELEKNQRTNNRYNMNKTPDLFEDDFDPDQIDHLLEMTNNQEKNIAEENKNKNKNKVIQMETISLTNQRNTTDLTEKNLSKPSTSTKSNSKKDLFDEYINEDDLFSNLDLSHIQPDINQVNTESNTISINKLLQDIQRVSSGSFKIRGKFKSVVEKLTMEKDEYKLTIMVEDETNETVCRVDSEVVSKWAGLTPVEIVNLKTSIFSQDLGSKRKVEHALQNIKDRLLEVNHTMEVQVNGKDTVPIIKNIFY